ncbi:MmpS family transport accessory protein [Mycolicibacter minnesotensis]
MRSAWVYLVVVATLGAAGAFIAHLRLSDIPDPAVGHSPLPPTVGRLHDKVVEYHLTGPAGTAIFASYLDVDGAVREVSTTLPWQITLRTQHLTVPAGVMAQSDSDPLSCRVVVDGQLRDEQSSSSTVSCTEPVA